LILIKFLLIVCRLFLVNDGWSSCPSKAKHWCELAESNNIRDDDVLSLRLKMINKDKKGGGKPVEELILKEIASRPHDVGLRTRLVNFLIEEKRFNDAFKYCFDLEMKFIENFQQSVDWYNCVANCFTKQTVTDNWNYWCLLLISLDKRIYLNLKKDLSLQAVKQTNLKEVTNLIFEFDQVLKKASDSLVVLTPTKELADEFVGHYRGQLALHIASIFIQKQKVSNNDQWRETIKKSLPFLLFAFQSSTVNTEAFWLKNTNDVIRNLFNHLKKEGAFRCAQSGRTLLACKNIGGDEKFGNLKMWKSIEDIFNQVRETCADLNWRKNIYRQLFANADQQTKISSSYIVQSSNFTEPKYEIISFNDIEMYEDIAQHLYPSSLEHQVYLGIGRKDLHSYKSRTFINLNLSTSNLISCSPETINRLDLDSFLYCAVIQAKRRLEAERDCFESFSKDPCEKPLMLPAANLVEGLCSDEQIEWWLSAYKVYKNISGDSLAQLKATLQYGIEAVRGIDTPKIDIIILLKLGDILLARAAAGEKVDERRHYELRAEYVFKIAMRMLRSKDNDNSRKLFKYSTVNLDVDRETDQLVGTAIGFLCTLYFKREEFKEFIEDFNGLNNAWASFFIAEAYKKLDESNKTPKKSKKLYAEKARENLIETLQLLDGNDNFERNNPLRSRVERELKRLQYDLSSSFNEDHEYHNVSVNGHTEDDIFHNASATSFRQRRELSAISQTYNEKFVEVENLIKKLNEAVLTVKDDVICVRNDITDLKDEVLNARGDIADMGKDGKVMENICKAIEDLTWQVSYMMNFTMPPNPAAARFPQPQMPSQMTPQMTPQIAPQMAPQMYNQPGYNLPNLPMQYPTPAMVQRTPQPPQLAYDPMALAQQTMQKNSLLEALNAPNVLSTWNSTYNNSSKMATPTVATTSKPTPQMIPMMSTSSNQFPSFVSSPQQHQQTPQFISQNKPVEKDPPVNVVITNSDPLPTQNSFKPQPTLSVTIPPQHIKHPPTAVVSKPVSTPQYENISPVKQVDTSEYLEEPADYDPRPDFKPIIPLPDEVETKTGEENEDVMFTQRCKLFRLVENEWKERGIGNIKILKGKGNGKYRILMRREQIHKLCANHTITSEMELKSTGKDTQWMWGASDFSEDEMHVEKFLVRFKTADQAKEFKKVFDDAKKNLPKSNDATSSKPQEVPKVRFLI
jgi:E3 SUMO-protein ligase RanBP2